MSGPTKLTPRHEILAMRLVQGKTDAEIAAELGYNVQRISVIKNSPLFRALMENLRKDVRDHAVLDLVGKVANLGETAIDTLRDAMDMLPSEPAVAVTAARDVLDRIPSTARISKSEEEKTVRVVIDAETSRRLEVALAEDEGRVVPAIATRVDGGPRVRTLDELLEETTD